uniref:DUF4318 domain-containing protein n=1 Tax=Meloidogyne hapla TaxID=6305 RepID=A0A1I8B1U8_MELHA
MTQKFSGIIVEQIRNPSKAIVCYKFCNEETTAIELFLDTDETEKHFIWDSG